MDLLIKSSIAIYEGEYNNKLFTIYGCGNGHFTLELPIAELAQ